MPKYWYSKYGISERTELEQNIVAPNKPYFMKYVYQTLKKEYDKMIKETNCNVIRKFCKYGIYNIDELVAYNDKTEEMKLFAEWFEKDMVVSDNGCIVNRICHLFEELYPSYSKLKIKSKPFDYTILKTDKEYSQQSYNQVKKIYDEYKSRLKSLTADVQNTDATSYAKECYYKEIDSRENEIEYFKQKCVECCTSEEELCNIVLDICYTNEHSKQFAWDISGETIIKNLLNRNGNKLSFPKAIGNEFEYAGVKFSMITVEVN